MNGKGRVDPATRTRVAEVADRLGYRANRHAISLRSGRSAAIGLLLPVRGEAISDEALSLDFYMRLAGAAAASAFDRRQALMLLPPQPTKADLRGMALDGGIIVDPAIGDARVALFDSLGTPFVTIERDLARDDGWFVGSRPAENTVRMLDHLAERGARRPLRHAARSLLILAGLLAGAGGAAALALVSPRAAVWLPAGFVAAAISLLSWSARSKGAPAAQAPSVAP